MPMSGVKLGGGPEYQLPSQETLVLAKAAVWALVSAPLTMMPRFALFVGLEAGAETGVVTIGAAWTVEEVLELGATTGAEATVVVVSATAGVDVLELDSAPIAASVVAEFTVGNGVLEAASVGETVRDSTGEDVLA